MNNKADHTEKTRQVIIHLEVFNDGTMNLQSALPPKELVKMLQNATTEIVFQTLEKKEEPRIVLPKINPNPLPANIRNENHRFKEN